MCTTTLGLLGKRKEGKLAGEELLRLKPEFPARGRALIKHYIKFDNLLERMVSGLRHAGIVVQ